MICIGEFDLELDQGEEITWISYIVLPVRMPLEL